MSVILDIVTAVGVVFASGWSAKWLRAGTRSRSRSPSDASGTVHTTPSNTSSLPDLESGTRLLQFWCMFGVFQFLSAHGFPYASEVKALVTIICLFPTQLWDGRAATASLFSYTAQPVMEKLAPPVETRLARAKQSVLVASGSTLRAVFNWTILWATKFSRPEDLDVLEANLVQCERVLKAEQARLRPNDTFAPNLPPVTGRRPFK